METKANYVLVGIFTLAVTLAAFGFVYWAARFGDGNDTLPLEIRIPGSVTGLSKGSQVLFNGIKVGDVRQMFLDPLNPNMVIVQSEVNRTTPITRSTKAELSSQGLTGIAFVELKGGSLMEPNLMEEAEKGGYVARINADPSIFTDLMATAKDIFGRTERVLGGLEGFVNDARGPLTDTVNNAKTFTDALAKNADVISAIGDNAADVQKTIQEAREMMQRLNEASKRVDGIMAKVDKLLSPEDREGVVAQAKATLASIQKTSDNLDKRLAPVADNLARFSGKGLSDVQSVVVDSRRSLQRIEQAITDLERDPQRIIFGGSGTVPQYDGRKRH
ncbi:MULTISPECIES: MlaD family protein [Pseudochrobactrum]|uniref:Phospholipid/cholesterol/gamma-HCH transport system substrate-binding protein n=1 Tax=Pseudochrobactrum saccharolyticum TaxID=354352 RepID=A0A7W8AI22_9HYPH|nr:MULTISPECIES: MlaD family protein [Pseudochrobactrum]KAB0539245.1 MCE family protein [Pseudochrobactrum saccharolyticum]MBB5090723.1 phospholipid/cholesterol/gamma-HCH transport system substrate-binding protein [Pseudochrobactrum saccharolyticum]